MPSCLANKHQHEQLGRLLTHRADGIFNVNLLNGILLFPMSTGHMSGTLKNIILC